MKKPTFRIAEQLERLGAGRRERSLTHLLAKQFHRGESDEIEYLAQSVGQVRALSFLEAVARLPLESPLEVLMYAALQIAGELVLPVYTHECLGDAPDHERRQPGPHLCICCQHVLEPYRLDFLLTEFHWTLDPSPQFRQVAIEVDGHDFHERTKEQARNDRQKDRAIQAAGLKVLRYTGSEVYKDPLGCAMEAVRAVHGADLYEYFRIFYPAK